MSSNWCNLELDVDDNSAIAMNLVGASYDVIDFPTVGNGLQLSNNTLSAKLGAGMAFDNNGGISLSGGDIGNAVDDWLDAHPEATTTVQDGSITAAKLATASVTDEKIDDYTITKVKFAAGEVVAEYNQVSGRLEKGSIKTTGVDDNSASSLTKRCRTKGYIEFPSDCSLWVKISDGFKIAMVSYYSDGTLRKDEYWYNASNHGEFGFSTCTDLKVRFVIAYVDDSVYSDLDEFENAVVVERYTRDRLNVTNKTTTFGAIRATNGTDITDYTYYPYITRTNGYVKFQNSAILLDVLSGYYAAVFEYDADGVFISASTHKNAGSHIVEVNNGHLYRFNIGRVGSTDLLTPAESDNVIRVIDGIVPSETTTIQPWTAEDERLAQQLHYNTTGAVESSNVNILHFSDLHGNENMLKRVLQYQSEKLPNVDDVICTGDIVNADWASDFTFWGTSGAENILMTMGNHDEIVDRTSWDSVSSYKTMAECYTRYMEPYIDSWGVTYEIGKTYYYKDYTGVRLIVLDLVQDYLSNDSAQLSWFQGVLASAITSGQAVVVAQHYPPENRIAVPGVGAWYDSHYTYQQPLRWEIRPVWQDAIETFKLNGGEFICWLCGHTHADLVSTNSNYPNQIMLIVDTANPTRSSPYSDTERTIDTPTQDLFNVIGFDLVHKTIRVMRVGASENMFLQKKKTLCIDYVNNIVIE